MSKLPRILPLTGVALVGVLAINAVAGARGLPNLFSAAKAFAAGAPAAKAAPPAKADDGAKPAATEVAAVDPNKPAPLICAPTAAELAGMAGLSPGELATLQSLKDRNQELTSLASSGDLTAKTVDAAMLKLDAKLEQLNALKAEMAAMVKAAQDQEQKDILRMVTVYSAMKPKQAAAAMALLSDEVMLPIAAGMKEAKLAPVLAAMTPAQAKSVTEKLANRYAAQAALARQAAVPAGATAAAPAAKAPAPTGAG